MEGSNLIIIISNIIDVIVDSIIAINSVTIYRAARISNVVVATSNEAGWSLLFTKAS